MSKRGNSGKTWPSPSKLERRVREKKRQRATDRAERAAEEEPAGQIPYIFGQGLNPFVNNESADKTVTANKMGCAKPTRTSRFPEINRSMVESRRTATARATRDIATRPTGHVDKTSQASGIRAEPRAESSGAQKPRGKHDVDRSDQVRKMRGPFSLPFDETVVAKYRFQQYRQRGHFSDVLPPYPENVPSGEIVRLQIGDNVVHQEPGLARKVEYRVLDFRRNQLIVGWREDAASSYIDAHQLDHGTFSRMRDGKANRIPSSAKLWVRRDPELSRRLVTSAMQTYTNESTRIVGQDGSTVQTTSNSDSVKPVKPIAILGTGTKENYPWTRLCEIPGLMQPILSLAGTFASEDMRTGHTCCIFCGCKIKTAARGMVGWPSLCTLEKPPPRNKRVYDSILDHCGEHHPAQVPVALVLGENTFLKGEPYTVKDRVQWALYEAASAHAMPTTYVQQLLSGNGKDFYVHLAQMFSFAQGANLHNYNLRKKGCFKGEKFAFRPFFLKADNTIRVIQQAFAAFDFRGLGESLPVPENVGRYTLLLNAINLFFVRGMYMETPFFPLLQLQKGFEASDEQPEPLKPAPGPEQSRQDSV